MADKFDRIVSYEDLGFVDLHVDRIYAGKTSRGRSLDPISRLFGVGVQGGIRFKGSAVKDSVRLVVLYSTGDNPDWRDQLDTQTGILTYYGDNRHPGRDLHDTHLGGNVAFRNAFKSAGGSETDRKNVSPFFYFERVQKEGSLVRFRGLAVPGAESLSSSDALGAMWWSKGDQRFQNYCARFTILDVPTIPYEWIDALVAGSSPLSGGCPDAWREWVETGAYRPLIAPRSEIHVRSKERQLPSDEVGREILAAIHEHFSATGNFDAFAADIWRLMAPAARREMAPVGGGHVSNLQMGRYEIGPKSDPVTARFILESDCGSPSRPVVDIERLTSRLGHRDFGVFVTLSYFDETSYTEVRLDGHPVSLVCGKDIVETLRREGFSDVGSVDAWLDSRFP